MTADEATAKQLKYSLAAVGSCWQLLTMISSSVAVAVVVAAMFIVDVNVLEDKIDKPKMMRRQ